MGRWVLGGGIGLAVVATLCVLGLVGLYVIGSTSGTPTPAPMTPLAEQLVPATQHPTAEPASPAPASPGPEATSAAGVLFNDDFSDPNTSKDNGWSADAGTNVDYALAPNQHTITVKKKQWLGIDWPNGSYGDFGVEVEGNAVGTDYTEYGITFRIGGSTDKRSYYIFGITNDGNYYLFKRLDGEWASPDLVKLTASPFVKQGTAKNVLRVLARGSEITLYINGNKVQTITDEALTSGEVGVFAGTGDNDSAEAAFSRFTILDAAQAAADWQAQ